MPPFIAGKRIDVELSEIEARVMLEALQQCINSKSLSPEKQTALVRGRDRLMSSIAVVEAQPRAYTRKPR